MINDSMPLVSIGIPTYNRADSYLKQAIQSAVAQTYSNVEIIVSDNCSTDNTEALVKEINHPRIRYFKQSENIGGLNNCNFCVKQAQGDYFLLLHDDDVIDNDFVDVCMKAVDSDTNFGVILTGTRIIDEDGTAVREDTNEAEGLSTRDLILSWFNYQVPLYLCSTLFNTNKLKNLGGFKSEKNLYDDGVALFQLAAKFGRKDVHDVKASFRRHPDNGGSAASISDWCEDSIYLLDVMCNAVADNDLIRREGMLYFSKVNYARVARIPSSIMRLYCYLLVYKTFAYSYSPIRVVFAKNIFYRNTYRLLRYLKRKISKALLYAPSE